MDPSKINNIQKCCRICLKIQPHMRFLSSSELIDGKLCTLLQMLKSCTSTQIVLDDSFPKMICQNCIDRLYLSWGFKVDCEKSEAKLQQNLNNKRKRDENTNLPTCSRGTVPNNTASTSNDGAYISNRPTVPEESFTERAKKLLTENLDKILNESLNISVNNMIRNNMNNNTATPQNNSNNNNSLQNNQAVRVNENREPLTPTSYILVNRNSPVVVLGRFRNQQPQQRQEQENIFPNENLNILEALNLNPIYKEEIIGTVPSCAPGEIIDLTMSDSDDKENEPTTNGNNDNNNNNKKQKLDAEVYKCVICDKTFETKQLHYMHLKTHINSDINICPICDEQFDVFSNLETHLNTHIENNVLKCPKCSKLFASIDLLTKHKKSHGIDEFNCELCSKTYLSKLHLQRHLKHAHSGVNQYFCDVCKEGFSLKIMFNQHMKLHANDDSFKCNVCKFSFNTFDELSKHNKTHVPVNSLKCNECGGALKKHDIKYCGTSGVMKCEICVKKFEAKSALDEHKQTYKRDKCYTCKLCERVFDSMLEAKEHAKTHYTCEKCSETFDNLRLLNIHKKKHAKASK